MDVYGFCPAGCRYPVVKKDDFIAAAPLIKQTIESGRCFLETGKQYKIFSSKNSNNEFYCSINFVYTDNGTEKTYNFSIHNEDKYADSVVFKLLETTTDGTTLTLVYEIAGIRYTEEISGTNIALIDKEYLHVRSARDVYLYNEDNTYVIENQTTTISKKGTYDGWNIFGFKNTSMLQNGNIVFCSMALPSGTFPLSIERPFSTFEYGWTFNMGVQPDVNYGSQYDLDSGYTFSIGTSGRNYVIKCYKNGTEVTTLPNHEAYTFSFSGICNNAIWDAFK